VALYFVVEEIGEHKENIPKKTDKIDLILPYVTMFLMDTPRKV